MVDYSKIIKLLVFAHVDVFAAIPITGRLLHCFARESE
jgi:hypothetical protein